MSQNLPALSKLTKKQRDVLALVADNRTSKEIAARLGISESAVNQRIEMVRAKVGGLPRGELARLYRQEISPEIAEIPENSNAWQKIHLPKNAGSGFQTIAESISLPESGGSHQVGSGGGDGSQLSAFIFRTDDNWLWREDRATAFVRFGAMTAIVAFALVIAFAVTQALGPVGS